MDLFETINNDTEVGKMLWKIALVGLTMAFGATLFARFTGLVTQIFRAVQKACTSEKYNKLVRDNRLLKNVVKQLLDQSVEPKYLAELEVKLSNAISDLDEKQKKNVELVQRNAFLTEEIEKLKIASPGCRFLKMQIAIEQEKSARLESLLRVKVSWQR